MIMTCNVWGKENPTYEITCFVEGNLRGSATFEVEPRHGVKGRVLFNGKDEQDCINNALRFINTFECKGTLAKFKRDYKEHVFK